MSRVSTLQDLMLISLEKHDAESVNQLAERVGSHRSAVSRSLKPLTERGLVNREGRSLYLTGDGHIASHYAQRRMEDRIEQLTSEVGVLVERLHRVRECP